MITSPQEYNDLLATLLNPNEYLQHIQVPYNEPVYEINLNSRKVEAPPFLSVYDDHNAEVIWFKVNRFYDCYDLSKCTCWIQYTNANNESFYYAAPLIVQGSKQGDDIILIPWAISREVAYKAGAVEFAFQFFTLSEDGQRFVYVLNTTPVKSKILDSLKNDEKEFIYDATKEFEADELRKIYSELNRLSGEYYLYWVDML